MSRGARACARAGSSVSHKVGPRGEMRDAAAATPRVLGPQEARG